MDLIGMKAICQHMNRSEATILIFIRDMDFPAKKIGGIWESNSDVIKEWKARIFNGEIKAEKKEESAPRKRLSRRKTRKKAQRSI